MSFCQSLHLFTLNSLSCCCSFKDNKLFKLYTKGKSKIDKEMDLVKILRNIRSMRIYSKMNIESNNKEKLKYIIRHSQKNLIDIDSDHGTDHSNDEH